MRAVLIEEFGVVPRIADVPAPECPPTGAVVRVKATGVCRSDWHAWSGHDSSVHTPHVPGHEFAGVVEQVGADVTRFRVGDRVTAPFVYACGRCAQCRAGDNQVCTRQEQPGSRCGDRSPTSSWCSRPTSTSSRCPTRSGYAEAAALGCRFATAYRAVATRAAVRRGEWVAVHGCGGVGLSAIVVARAAGAQVVAVDVSPDALAAAERLGAVTLRSGPTAVDDIRSITGGGAHVSLDAFGSAATCRASIASLRPRGRHVQVGLLLGDEAHAAAADGRRDRERARHPRQPRHGGARVSGDARRRSPTGGSRPPSPSAARSASMSSARRWRGCRAPPRRRA